MKLAIFSTPQPQHTTTGCIHVTFTSQSQRRTQFDKLQRNRKSKWSHQ